jgi:hypothetical protein
MSYEISYRRQAFMLTAARAQHYDDLFFLVEERGSNNCWEIGNRRRARSWDCMAAGAKWECLTDVTSIAAACCGGSLCLYGCRGTTPETYIRAWRKTIAAVSPFEDAPRLGFRLQLFTRISDADARDDRKRAFEQLQGQTVIPARRDKDEFSGADYTEWRFNAEMPEQVKLWLETKARGRGYLSVDADGPHR